MKWNSPGPDSKEVLINNLANITFIDKHIDSEIGDNSPKKYMDKYITAAKKHLIPTDRDLWSIDQYTTFLQYRAKLIYTTGKKYFGEIFE